MKKSELHLVGAWKRSLVSVLMFGLIGHAFAQDNLLNDPGFEESGTWGLIGEAERFGWAARSGDYGIAFEGWKIGEGATLSQVVEATEPGTYTFSIYVLAEADFTGFMGLELRMEWLDDMGGKIGEVIEDWSSLPSDVFWHHLHVTGEAPAGLEEIRVVVDAFWTGGGSGDQAVWLDDAALYQGGYAGILSLANPSFEEGRESGFRGAMWMLNPESSKIRREPWAKRNGDWGIGFIGWDDTTTRDSRFSQPLAPGPGTYEFSVWIKREANFLINDAALRIEWYDVDFAEIQPAAVETLTILNDGQWHQYAVSGTYTNADLYEVRPVIHINWTGNEDGSDPRGMSMDDASFVKVFEDRGIETEWAYHAAPDVHPQIEQVPGGHGTFRMINYDTEINTFFILTHPDLALDPGDTAEVYFRQSFNRPGGGGWSNVVIAMDHFDTVEIPAGSFRGQPATGTATVDVWRVDMPAPADPLGDLYDDPVTVYYAPYILTTDGSWVTDQLYLVDDGELENDLGQNLDLDFMGRDYSFVYAKPENTELLNADFNYPTAIGLADSDWFGWGPVSRDTWADRRKLDPDHYGGWFDALSAAEAGVYQDIMVDPGAYLFSLWVRMETGVNPTDIRLRMEWYNTAGSVVQVNETDITGLSKDPWHHVWVAGAYEESDLHFVRVMLDAQYADKLPEGMSAIMFDDARFYELGDELLNPGFETGHPDLEDWFGLPGNLVRHEDWAFQTGSYGAAFRGWFDYAPSFEATLAQPVVAAPGEYVFSLSILREPGFNNLTDAELRLEWYDGLFNKVQADTVQPLSIPLDDDWHAYSVTGTCSHVQLAFVVPTFYAAWDVNTAAGDKAIKIDDASLDYEELENDVTDGIPNWWWDLYSVPAGQRIAANYPPGHSATYEENFIADTDPTDPNSYFGVVNITGAGILQLEVDPPLTGTRIYDVWWSADLAEEPQVWTSFGLDVEGDSSDPAISLTITNEVPNLFFRTGVKLPPEE